MIHKPTIKFVSALILSLYFYTRMDILIWQRIFEANQLYTLGMGVYHRGWLQALFGFMAVGLILFLPDWRRALWFPVSLRILALSGLEDILYYVLDRRPIPAALPWLESNPMLLHPVTNWTLIVSALFWTMIVILVVVMIDFTKEKK